MTDRFNEVDETTKTLFDEILAKLNFAMRIDFRLIGDSKLKKLVTVKRNPPVQEFITKHQILVYINEPLLDLLDVEPATVELLFIEELNNINFNLEKGTIKIGKPNLNTATAVIEKFGLTEVMRVKELERSVMASAEEKAKEQPPIDTQTF